MHTLRLRMRHAFCALFAVALVASLFAPLVPAPTASAQEGQVMATEQVNVRSGPSTADGILGELQAGDWVTTTGYSTNDFTEIYFGDFIGYVYTPYISFDGGTVASPAEEVPAAPTDTTTWGAAGTLYTADAVNLRSGPGTGEGIVAVLPVGATLSHTGAYNNGFAEVNSDYGYGWVHSDYLVASAPVQAPAAEAPQAPAVSTQGQQIVNFAMQYHGYPYVWAGNTPSGFDCSGFTQYVVQNTMGYDITHSADLQAGYGSAVGWGEWQPGDLVFFSGTGASGFYSHVGIYIGDGQMIHAENEGTGVVISSLYSSYYSSHYAYAVRL